MPCPRMNATMSSFKDVRSSGISVSLEGTFGSGPKLRNNHTPIETGKIRVSMLQSLIEARKWLVAAAVLVIAIVGVSYFAAKFRVKPTLHNIPKELGIDIQ